MDIGQSLADLGTLGPGRRAFTADELGELLGSVVYQEDLESALSAHPNIVSFGADQVGQKWYALKSDLFGWFCYLNYRLARARVFQLESKQLARAMSSLRIEGQWKRPPEAAVAFGKHLGLVGDTVMPEYYAFPLARLLSSMPGLAFRAARSALRDLARIGAWQIPLEERVGEYVRDGFAECDHRERAIVLRRTGLQTGHKMTLAEAGSPWHLTRERTRQLEDRFWSRLKARAGVGRQRRQTFVMALLCDFLAQQGSLVVPVSSGTAHLRAFLARCSLLPVLELRRLELLVLAATKQGLRALESRRHSPHELTAEAIAQRLASDGPLGLINRDVLALSRAAAEYRRKHLKTPQRVYLTLRTIGKPAHYSRIAEVHNTMFPDKISSEQSIHNCLCRELLGVVWVGARGTYALQEWGYERPTATLFDSAADIVENKYGETGRPVPYSVIVAEMAKLRPIINPASLTFATHCNDRLQRLEGNCFVPLSEGVGTGDEPTMEELDQILRDFQSATPSRETTAAD